MQLQEPFNSELLTLHSLTYIGEDISFNKPTYGQQPHAM